MATDAVADFVQFNEIAGNTEIFIDTAGTGTFTPADQITTLIGVTGLDLNEMVADGNLVI